MIKSNFKYPLTDKVTLASKVLSEIPTNSNYSLYHYGDIMLANGGWASIFDYEGNATVKGNISLYWDHTYETYNLYHKKFTSTDPEYVVMLFEKGHYKHFDSEISSGTVGNVDYAILDNTKGWFSPDLYKEELYQPKYF